MTNDERELLRMLVEGMLLIHAGEDSDDYARALYSFASHIGVLDRDKIGPPKDPA